MTEKEAKEMMELFLKRKAKILVEIVRSEYEKDKIRWLSNAMLEHGKDKAYD